MKKIKFNRFLGLMLITLVSICSFLIINTTNARANITHDGNTYTVNTGKELFSLLGDSSSYWNDKSNPIPDNLVIKIANDVTLPRSSPHNYAKLKNVTVDFQGHTFYVESQSGSTIGINYDDSPQVIVSNLNIDHPDVTSNTVDTSGNNIPDSSGGIAKSGIYYTTYYGMLFSGNLTLGVSNCNASVTYNNVIYNLPNDLYYNQPICTYYVPLNFTGNNRIVSGSNGQELAELPNINVNSGTTILHDTSVKSIEMLHPYSSKMFNTTFPITINSSATLNLINDTIDPMLIIRSYNTPAIINNNGTLNMTSTASGNSFFGSRVTGVTLNSNSGSSTELNSQGDVINSSSLSDPGFFNANLANDSNTVFVAQNGSVLKNSSKWKNSGINVDSGAKMLTYSGGTTRGGLTNTDGNTIPFNFNGSSTSLGYDNAPIPSAGINSYDGLTPVFNKTFNTSGIESKALSNNSNNAFYISPGLSAVSLPTNNYQWKYSTNVFSDTNKWLPRTGIDPLSFAVKDIRSDNPSFHITAQYIPNQDQPFDMGFENNNNVVTLNNTAQKIIDGNDFSSNKNGTYTKAYDNNSGNRGLVIKSKSENASSGDYTGTVTWNLVDGPND